MGLCMPYFHAMYIYIVLYVLHYTTLHYISLLQVQILFKQTNQKEGRQ